MSDNEIATNEVAEETPVVETKEAAEVVDPQEKHTCDSCQ